MTDCELLELAAKAAGIERLDFGKGTILTYDNYGHTTIWDPLTDDGDALRLATNLGFNLYHAGCSVYVEDLDAEVEIQQGHERDKMSATRRAIVRAAATIGEEMP